VSHGWPHNTPFLTQPVSLAADIAGVHASNFMSGIRKDDSVFALQEPGFPNAEYSRGHQLGWVAHAARTGVCSWGLCVRLISSWLVLAWSHTVDEVIVILEIVI